MNEGEDGQEDFFEERKTLPSHRQSDVVEMQDFNRRKQQYKINIDAEEFDTIELGDKHGSMMHKSDSDPTLLLSTPEEFPHNQKLA